MCYKIIIIMLLNGSILYYYSWSTLIEKDHLGDWSPEKDCCLWLTFQQPVQKPSSESRLDSDTWLWKWLPHRLSKRESQTTVLLRTPITSFSIKVCYSWVQTIFLFLKYKVIILSSIVGTLPQNPYLTLSLPRGSPLRSKIVWC